MPAILSQEIFDAIFALVGNGRERLHLLLDACKLGSSLRAAAQRQIFHSITLSLSCHTNKRNKSLWDALNASRTLCSYVRELVISIEPHRHGQSYMTLPPLLHLHYLGLEASRKSQWQFVDTTDSDAIRRLVVAQRHLQSLHITKIDLIPADLVALCSTVSTVCLFKAAVLDDHTPLAPLTSLRKIVIDSSVWKKPFESLLCDPLSVFRTLEYTVYREDDIADFFQWVTHAPQSMTTLKMHLYVTHMPNVNLFHSMPKLRHLHLIYERDQRLTWFPNILYSTVNLPDFERLTITTPFHGLLREIWAEIDGYLNASPNFQWLHINIVQFGVDDDDIVKFFTSTMHTLLESERVVVSVENDGEEIDRRWLME